MNKILKESPYNYNIFRLNKALFANDFYTFPIKVRFQDDNKFKSWVNKSSYAITIIPGFTQINLNFSVVDYYGQTILVNRFFFIFLQKFVNFLMKYFSFATKKFTIWRCKPKFGENYQHSLFSYSKWFLKLIFY